MYFSSRLVQFTRWKYGNRFWGEEKRPWEKWPPWLLLFCLPNFRLCLLFICTIYNVQIVYLIKTLPPLRIRNRISRFFLACYSNAIIVEKSRVELVFNKILGRNRAHWTCSPHCNLGKFLHSIYFFKRNPYYSSRRKYFRGTSKIYGDWGEHYICANNSH